MSVRDPVARAEYQRRYRQTEKGKAARRRELDDPTQKAIRKEAQSKYYSSEKGRAAHNEYQKEYAKSEAGKEAILKRKKERLDSDPNFRLATLLRIRFHHALKGGSKVGSTVKDLGCTIDEFKVLCMDHPNWRPEWDFLNLGTLWQIDHIKPLALFDLTKPEEQLRAIHYTNLQPISIEEHKKKTAEDRKLIQAHKAAQVLNCPTKQLCTTQP